MGLHAAGAACLDADALEGLGFGGKLTPQDQQGTVDMVALGCPALLSTLKARCFHLILPGPKSHLHTSQQKAGSTYELTSRAASCLPSAPQCPGPGPPHRSPCSPLAPLCTCPANSPLLLIWGFAMLALYPSQACWHCTVPE